MEIKLKTLAGSFAENKDIAKDIRLKQIMPALEKREKVIVDFTGVDGATQSFIHALISDPIRKYGDIAFDNMYYSNANDDIQEIISIVYRYMQESMYGEAGGVVNDIRRIYRR